MSTSVDRREAMKLAAMAAATGLAHSYASRAESAAGLPPLPERPEIAGVTWDKAPCRFCGTGCHVQVGVREGKVVAIAGDQQAEVNRGLLCVKGYHVGGILYGADRLTKPMLRVDGALQPIEWEEAIDIVAKRILEAGPKFGMYLSGQSTIPEGYAGTKLMRAGLSSNHIDANARLCMSSAVTGFLSTYGVDEPASCFDDLDNCDALVLWGNNPAEMHPVLFSRVIDRRVRGDKIEVFDIGTRWTRSTERADHHLLMKPHGDLAIANGVANLLVEWDAVDDGFVSRHCNFRADRTPSASCSHEEYVAMVAEKGSAGLYGEPIDFDQYKRLVSYYTPERTAELSGVPVEQLVTLAKLFADKKRRVVSLWCMGMNQHTAGTAVNNLVHGLHLLSGHWGKPGDGLQRRRRAHSKGRGGEAHVPADGLDRHPAGNARAADLGQLDHRRQRQPLGQRGAGQQGGAGRIRRRHRHGKAAADDLGGADPVGILVGDMQPGRHRGAVRRDAAPFVIFVVVQLQLTDILHHLFGRETGAIATEQIGAQIALIGESRRGKGGEQGGGHQQAGGHGGLLVSSSPTTPRRARGFRPAAPHR